MTSAPARASRHLAAVCAVALALLSTPGLPARVEAEEPEPIAAVAPAPPAAPVPEPPKVEVAGYVDTYYGYSSNSADPLLRSFDVQHDTASLSAAEVSFAKVPAADSRLGFRTDLFFGKAADLTAAFEPAEDGREIYRHVQQAYVSLLTGRVQWDAGKFVTPMGAEVIESQDNWNYTRSILFGYAIPFYHLGLRATLPVNDRLSLSGQLVNGWNNASENNGEKTVHVSLTAKPASRLTWVANYMVGHEAPRDAAVRDLRNLFDTTLTVAATPRLSLMANLDYGKEGEVSWWGIAGYAKFQVRDAWALAGRYEYVDDTDGGFMTIGTKAQSLTLTSDHLIAGGLRARLEYRLDLADDAIFTKSSGSAADDQSTVTVGLVYGFSGKI